MRQQSFKKLREVPCFVALIRVRQNQHQFSAYLPEHNEVLKLLQNTLVNGDQTFFYKKQLNDVKGLIL